MFQTTKKGQLRRAALCFINPPMDGWQIRCANTQLICEEKRNRDFAFPWSPATMDGMQGGPLKSHHAAHSTHAAHVRCAATSWSCRFRNLRNHRFSGDQQACN